MNFRKYLVWENYLLWVKYRLKQKYKKSYAQCGEDILMDLALSALNIDKPTYIDVGANHPVLNSNTYLFYQRGGRGVCVEPNPALWRVLKRERPRDMCLNAGVAATASGAADFYVMSSTPLGTFSKEEARKYVEDKNYGHQEIREVIRLPLLTIHDILEKYFTAPVDILSVDTEGYDLDIVRSIDYSRHRPKLICVETARYDESGTVRKLYEVNEHLEQNGYVLFADSYINSIYLDKTYLRHIR
jgi:FkbM family methyltransferase